MGSRTCIKSFSNVCGQSYCRLLVRCESKLVLWGVGSSGWLARMSSCLALQGCPPPQIHMPLGRNSPLPCLECFYVARRSTCVACSTKPPGSYCSCNIGLTYKASARGNNARAVLQYYCISNNSNGCHAAEALVWSILFAFYLGMSQVVVSWGFYRACIYFSLPGWQRSTGCKTVRASDERLTSALLPPCMPLGSVAIEFSDNMRFGRKL
jgi:hypothetical protein